MHFKKATELDLDFLASLRNDPVSIRFSNRGRLPRHVIETDYLHNPGKTAYIAMSGNRAVGYLIFETLAPDVLEISVAVSRDHRLKGYGRSIICKGTEFAANRLGAGKIIARIYPENSASLKIFKICGYRISNRAVDPWELARDLSEKPKVMIVFDFDGVLLDSLSVLYEIYLEFLSEFGIKGRREEFNLLNGPSLSEIVSYLKVKHTLPPTEETLLETYKAKLCSGYEKAGLNEGAEAILCYLKRLGIGIVLATSSTRKQVMGLLSRHHIQHYFDDVVTGDEVKTAKPSPEIYLKVRDRFPTYDLYAVEDAENGLKAAMDAGLKTMFFNPDGRAAPLETDYEIDALERIGQLLTEIDLNCRTVSRASELSMKFIDHEPPIKADQRDRIRELWDSALEEKRLFNGKITACHTYERKKNSLHIIWYETEYKNFIAQTGAPDLDLRIRPIGVSGIVIDPRGNVLVGTRRNVTEYEGFLEFVPSGGIDGTGLKKDPDYFMEQLVMEFEEETGASRAHIREVQPLCLILDGNHGVYDICCKISLKKDLADVINTGQTHEYSELQIISARQLQGMIHSNNFVPTSIVLWHNFTAFQGDYET